MRLHFQTVGHGPALIILHGLFGSSDNWIPIARKLSDAFKVIAVDQRNHGRSPHSAEMNYPLMADDLAGLMEDHGLERAHILGHSMGGKTAMQFALSHPAKVEKLVVADMAPRAYQPGHTKIFQALLSLDLARFQHRSQVSDALAAEIPEQSLRLFLLKMLGRKPDGALFWQTNISALQANSESLRAALATPVSSALPALFIRGEKSDYVRDDDLPGIQRLFPNANVRTVSGVGHWLHVEAPDAFVAEVLAFSHAKIA